MIKQALDTYEPWRVRSRCFVQADLALAHLASRDLEQAASVGRDAVRMARQVSSNRVLDRLRMLQRRVRPLSSTSPDARELDDRITDLTRTRTHRDEDTAT
ncbi:hypothetical protein C1701_00735 [Actinoalloteichus sp. AHMU CJ021]|uniref:hypothetical protein n=1 Tax=Actinoalloteichus TaxID=65496 RepID=UPI0004AA54E9|nr:hypothetical protein [Actinoalloteichus caeruleus]AUS77129.1 hypothetical protein C1701_00735 [Actinoalloteichus sp. AHMU CJ021]